MRNINRCIQGLSLIATTPHCLHTNKSCQPCDCKKTKKNLSRDTYMNNFEPQSRSMRQTVSGKQLACKKTVHQWQGRRNLLDFTTMIYMFNYKGLPVCNIFLLALKSS